MEIETTIEAFAQELKNTAPQGIIISLKRRPINNPPGIKTRTGVYDIIIATLTFVQDICKDADKSLFIAWLVKVAKDPRTKNITGGERISRHRRSL